MNLANALPNWTEGTTYQVMQIPWTDEDGTAVDLTGATFTGLIINTDTGVSRAVAGTLEQDGSVDSRMNWTLDAADAAPGTFEVQFTATFSSQPLRTFRADWYVEAAIPAPS